MKLFKNRNYLQNNLRPYVTIMPQPHTHSVCSTALPQLVACLNSFPAHIGEDSNVKRQGRSATTLIKEQVGSLHIVTEAFVLPHISIISWCTQLVVTIQTVLY